MPSPAALKYSIAVGHIRTLRRTATDSRLRPTSRDEKQVYYHAALAAYVAAWNAYISNLVRNFYNVIAEPLNLKFDAVYTLAKGTAENALTRLIRQTGKIHATFLSNTQDMIQLTIGSGFDGEW